MQRTRGSSTLHPAVVAWALLMLATAISWWLGSGHGLPDNAKAIAVTIIAVVAFVKVHLVGMYFMDLRHAPRTLKLSFIAWTILTCAVVLGLYLRA